MHAHTCTTQTCTHARLHAHTHAHTRAVSGLFSEFQTHTELQCTKENEACHRIGVAERLLWVLALSNTTE